MYTKKRLYTFSCFLSAAVRSAAARKRFCFSCFLTKESWQSDERMNFWSNARFWWQNFRRISAIAWNQVFGFQTKGFQYLPGCMRHAECEACYLTASDSSDLCFQELEDASSSFHSGFGCFLSFSLLFAALQCIKCPVIGEFLIMLPGKHRKDWRLR